MPGESGMELYDSLTAAQPELSRRFVFMTGGSFLPEAERFLDRVHVPCIEKPFDLEQLHAAVKQVVG